jgi:hypothetical protein
MAPESSLPATDWSSGALRPRVPLFFLSYAHTGRPGKLVTDFFDDLSEDVAALIGLQAGTEPGFMDRSMPGGVRWLAELLDAVGSCQVFIALLSDPYVTSQWCSKEWYAFSRRKVVSITDDPVTHRTGMIPVVWSPMPARRCPQVVSDVQRFLPRGLAGEDISDQYETDGVYGFKRLNQESQYRCVVWRLAQSIAEFHFACQVEPLILRPVELRDIFRETPS